MTALDLAKKLYPALSKQDFIAETCPDNLFLVDKISCSKTKQFVDDACIKCWNKEVTKERADWLIESKRMCDLMGC